MADLREEDSHPIDVPSGPLADRSAVKEKSRKVESRAQRDIDDLASILSDIRGRRFIRRYIEECGVFKTSFNNSGSVTAFNEGARNIGLKLWAEVIEADPDAVVLMQAEFKKENQNG